MRRSASGFARRPSAPWASARLTSGSFAPFVPGRLAFGSAVPSVFSVVKIRPECED